MAKHSKSENEKRAAEHARMKEIEQAWLGSLSKPARDSFVAAGPARIWTTNTFPCDPTL